MWQDWVNAILGLIVVGVAVFSGLSSGLAWTLGIIGTLVAILGFWGAGSVSQATMKHA